MSNILFIVCIILPILCIGSGGYFLIQDQKKRDILSIVLISAGLSFIAFYTLPNASDDLQRHFDVMENYQNHSIMVIFYSGYSFVYLNNLIMYIIAQTNLFGLYQAIFTFIGYFFLFKLIRMIYDDLDLQSKNILIGMFLFIFCMSFYKTYILAIRNYFCFITGAYYCYALKTERIRIRHYLIIILLLTLIHPVSLVLMIPFLIDRIKNRKIQFALLAGIFFHYPILKVLLSICPKDAFIYLKIQPYLNGTIQPYNTNYMILYMLLALFALFVIILMYKQKFYRIKYLILYTVLALSTFYQFDLIRRFMYLVPLFMIEPLFILLSERKIKKYFRFKNLKIKLTHILSFSMLSLSIASILATYANIRAYGWYWIF